jgi:predicted nucleotidyltransferase
VTELTISEGDAARLPALLNVIPRSIQVIAFGSRVTGRSRPFSDLDLCLKGTPNLSDSQLAEIREKFQLSDLSIKVDLVRYEDLPLSFQAEVDRAGIPLQQP